MAAFCRKKSILGPNGECSDYIYGITSQLIVSTQMEILSKPVLGCVCVCVTHLEIGTIENYMTHCLEHRVKGGKGGSIKRTSNY